ncbi:MAG: shikimate dehydrogenase [Thermoleophilaceae bacterium]|jgi:shikimate dehydrogenase|nr:shikimate dehydrogenase [Thermoleophilaceae bacterium]
MPPTLCGVLGQPVGHSRSPAIHNAAYAELGLDWRYVKLPVPPELFEQTVRGLPGSGYRGANVTIPHKLAALAVADSASPAARAVGAANTLTFADGRIEAENTDAGGLIDAIGRPVEGMRALVLGAGGAGRAAAWALREAGAEVAVWNRTPERAAHLAGELGVTRAERLGAIDLLVNATSVGLDPAMSEERALAQLPLAGAEPPALVVDLVYRDAGTTPVQAWAERGGAAVVDGREVLVRQGARSFELWTGQPAPLAAMRAAARAG